MVKSGKPGLKTRKVWLVQPGLHGARVYSGIAISGVTSPVPSSPMQTIHPLWLTNLTPNLGFLNFCGLNPQRYKSHSFRIDAACLAADKGFSDAQIRALGRWKSDAFKLCIRNSTLQGI